ncbi:TRAP transporter substrate-binding protein [Bacteroidota bacterium]
MIRSLLLFIILLVLSACTTRKDSKVEYVLLAGHQANEKDIWHQSLAYFADRVTERSNGRVEVRVYPNEQLGKERELIRSIKLGVVDITTTGETMQNWAKLAAFCAIPYLIRDSEHFKMVVDGAIGDLIEQDMIDKIGLRPIAYFERGARHLTSNRPIKVPEDLDGIILRVPNVPVFVKIWESLGAKPTPMTFSEVFTALQQGTVEAQENPYSFIYTSGFYEVQDYINLTQHVIGWVYVVIGEDKFQKLPEDVQEMIILSAQDMQDYHQSLFQKEELELERILKEKGMTFVNAESDKFRAGSREAVLDYLDEEQRVIYEMIENL